MRHKFNEGEKVMLGDTEVEVIRYLGYGVYYVSEGGCISEVMLKEKIEYEYDLWKAETRTMSKLSEILSNQHYRNIVGMGEKVVPFILKKIKKQPDHIVYALDDIFGPIEVISLEDYCKLWTKLYS